MDWIKRKYEQVKRVIAFLPIIWSGYDWDYSYAIKLFKYQLSRTANELDRDNAVSEDSNVRAHKIRTAIKLMDKVYDEEYACEYQDHIEALYGKTSYDFIEIAEQGLSGRSCYELKTTNEFAVDEKHQQEIDELRHQLLLLSVEKQKKAHRILWSYIEHNIQRWVGLNC